MKERLIEEFEDLLFADGFDDAIIGVDVASQRVVYSVPIMMGILMKDDMSEQDAIEYLEYNVFFAYVGEKTPIYVFEVD